MTNSSNGSKITQPMTATGGSTPFIQWSSTGADSDGGDIVTTADYRRSINMVTRPNDLVMVLESATVNCDTSQNTTTGSFIPKWRGIHGEALNNNLDGYANFSVFDGHVSKYSTA